MISYRLLHINNEMTSVVKKNILYRMSSSGRMLEWSITMTKEGDSYVLVTSHCQVGGKVVTDKGEVVSKGKVKRTVLEQAELRYNSIMKKKTDTGYTSDESGVNPDLPISPMLAQNGSQHVSKIVFPAVGQYKFDGIRNIARKINGKWTNVSRKGKQFLVLDHVSDALEKLEISENVVFDGEMYSDIECFETVAGIVRKKNLSEKDYAVMANVKFNVFDCIFLDDLEMTFENRFEKLKNILSNDTTGCISAVEVFSVDDENSIEKLVDKALDNGYEGLMVRNKYSPYEIDKRSYHLQKFKRFIDGEYEIVGAREGQGNDKGTVIWMCKLTEDKQFSVRPMGTRDERKMQFLNQKDYIGKMLTVKYQELTKDGVPRFPVGVTIRDYE